MKVRAKEAAINNKIAIELSDGEQSAIIFLTKEQWEELKELQGKWINDV